jgi:hypothetical protein
VFQTVGQENLVSLTPIFVLIAILLALLVLEGKFFFIIFLVINIVALHVHLDYIIINQLALQNVQIFIL